VEKPKPAVTDSGSPKVAAAKVTVEKPVTRPTAVPNPGTPKPASAISRGSEYSVQVAAYAHKPEADKLAATLSKRGYSARVDGSIAPFRVRIGRYASENEAEAALRKIKSSHMDGFVVRAPER
jgi:cell division protein FtsN